MKFFKLNEAQRKHLAGLVDKIAWAYIAGVGGLACTASNMCSHCTLFWPSL